MTVSTLSCTPSVVITLGKSLMPVAMEVKRLLLREDTQRMVTTAFLHPPHCGMEWSPGWISQENPGIDPNLSPCSWKQVFEQAQAADKVLKEGLQASLHDLRSHGRLMEAGLGEKAFLPLDIFLLADLSEAEAAALLVVIPQLQSILKEEPYARLHFLFNLASFQEDALQNANQFFTLSCLVEMLDGSERFPKLDPRPQIYLFDRYKEGTWEAQDAAEVHVLLENFLLALLSGGLAQHLAHAIPALEAEEQHAYFSSAGATSLIFDPNQLQVECVRRLALELLESEFDVSLLPDPGPLEAAVQDFMDQQGRLQGWRESLCHGTGFHPLPAQNQLKFHIADLRFEDVPPEEWARRIREYARKYEKQAWPACCAQVDENARSLQSSFLERLENFMDRLPHSVRFYPGGVQAAREVIQVIQKEIHEQIHHPQEYISEAAWQEQMEANLVTLEHALAALPEPPKWVKRLPTFAKKPVVQLFNLVCLRRELQTLLELRQKSMSLLERKLAARMEQFLHQKNTELEGAVVEVLKRQDQQLTRLQRNLSGMKRHFLERTDDPRPSSCPFRIQVVDESVLAWAYYQGQRPPEGFLHNLLEDHAFLQGWQKVSSKDLMQRLKAFCEEVYRPLQSLDIGQILQHRAQKDIRDLADALRQGTVPLLRPDFDQTGSNPAFQLRFFLAGNAIASSMYEELRHDLPVWQAIESGSASQILCCRVRLLIPGSSLALILERGRPAYKALDKEQRRENFL
ncbi:MAG: hypothetical protein HYZ25_16145 [Chloroflexi bacterium]|nr:hypothetical protein [Chloroflexota bacterium]